ncbi:MAG: S9 family peptidase [Armatimonadetes bacterium]|nr:S9 family peptidase [Armatimonadota bacterium]
MARRPVSIDDLVRLRFLSDVALSPDGRTICFVQTWVEHDAEKDEQVYRSHLWLVPADAGEPRQLTRGNHRDSAPVWSPDGRRLAFLSTRGGDEKQLWSIEVDGGEARALVSRRGGVAGVAWSPRGDRLAFVGKVGADPLDDEPDKEKAKRKRANRVKVITRMRYKAEGEGYWDGKWRHVFVVDANGGAPVQVTAGDFDHVQPAWSPDGQALAYVANPSPDADFTNVTDVWVIAAAGGGARRISTSLGPSADPAWAPDGRQIAYFGHDNQHMGATNPGLWVAAADGSGTRSWTSDWDRPTGHHVLDDMKSHPAAGAPVWSPDGRVIWFLGGDGGSTQLFEARADGSVRPRTAGARDLYGISFSADRRSAAGPISTPVLPGDVVFLDLSGAALATETARTSINAALLDEIEPIAPEHAWFEGADGWPVEGWILKPRDAAADAKVPIVLQIHGGPHGAYGWAFFHEFQMLAAEGIAVLYVNPRGSQNYGQAFCAATKNDWGGKDYEDLMRAFDQALARWPWLDGTRAGVAGGSYGGYMTNWIIGRTDRFRAAATMRSISNNLSQWGTSDLAFTKGLYEYPGDPWDAPAFYVDRSPLFYVRNMKTPLLIIHSENDYRCPIEQAEQLFAALKKLGVETVFVRFPNENHDLSRSGQPEHRLDSLRWISRWFGRHLLGATDLP